MKPLLLCISLLCFLVADKTPLAAKSRRFDTQPKITAISGSSISVKAGKLTHTYKINSTTAVHLDGRKVNANVLQKGMHAEVTASQINPDTASSIEATSGT